MNYQNEIAQLEARFVEAMKTSHVVELDALIDDSLIFTNHSGQLYTKQDDLNAHREGNIEIFEIAISEQHIAVFGDVAVVSVRKEISGSFFGETLVGIFRFTRVWKQANGGWKVIAAHSTQIIH
ncbi:MAG: nuclear transport factor 2 family protein [Flavobacterium sp.]